MKCKIAQKLALTWYLTYNLNDKRIYLDHRKQCAFCRLEFIRECKRLEQSNPLYIDEVIDLS